jgi:hypothetical protein
MLKLADLQSQILALFDSSPLIQNSKFNNFLWVCLFLGKIFVFCMPKEIGDKEPYYSTKISIFSFIWAGLAALHKASTI